MTRRRSTSAQSIGSDGVIFLCGKTYYGSVSRLLEDIMGATAFTGPIQCYSLVSEDVSDLIFHAMETAQTGSDAYSDDRDEYTRKRKITMDEGERSRSEGNYGIFHSKWEEVRQMRKQLIRKHKLSAVEAVRRALDALEGRDEKTRPQLLDVSAASV